MDEIKIPIEVDGGDAAVKTVKELGNFIEKLTGSVDQTNAALLKNEKQLKGVDDAIKSLNNAAQKQGQLSQAQQSQLQALTIQREGLKRSIAEERQQFNAQIKEMTAASGSYDHMNQLLGLMRDHYRQMSEAERESASGRDLLKYIKQLDTELKTIDASMGNYQRNVGNYQSGTQGLTLAVSGLNSGLAAMLKTFDFVGIGIDKDLQKIGQIATQSLQSLSRLEKSEYSVLGWLKSIIGQLNALKVTLVATGIGAFAVLVGVLAANWEKVKSALSGVTKAQDTFNQTEREALKNTKEQVQTIQTYSNYLQAGNLTLSQRKTALKELAKAMGDTVDITKDYNAEEERILSNANNYIQIQVKKAQVELLIAKNAELQYNMQEKIRAQQERTTAWWFKILPQNVQLLANTLGIRNVTKTIENTTSEIANNEDNIQSLLSEIGTLSGKLNISTSEENKLLEKQKRLRQQIASITFDPDDVDKAYAKLVANYQKEQDLLKQALDKKAITRAEYNEKMIASEQSFMEAVVELTRERYDREQQLDDAAFKRKQELAQARKEEEIESVRQAAELQYNIETKFGEASEIRKLKAQVKLNETLHQLDIEQSEAHIQQLQEQLEQERLSADERERIQIKLSAAERSLTNMRIQYAQEEAAAKRKLREQEAEYYLGLIGQELQAAANMVSSLSELYEEGSEEQKKMQIASAVINGLGGVANAWAQALGSMPPPFSYIAGAISTASVVATTAAQIRKIKSGTDDISGTGSAAAATPVVGTVLDTAALSSQLTNETELDLQQARQDTRVYVVEEDITRTQEDVRVTVDESDF